MVNGCRYSTGHFLDAARDALAYMDCLVLVSLNLLVFMADSLLMVDGCRRYAVLLREIAGLQCTLFTVRE